MDRFIEVSRKWLLVVFVAVGFAFLGSILHAASAMGEETETETEFGVVCTDNNGTVHFDAGWVYLFYPANTRCNLGRWAIKNGCCSGGQNWGAQVAGWGDDGYDDPGWATAACISNAGQGSVYGTCICNKYGDNCDYDPVLEG